MIQTVTDIWNTQEDLEQSEDWLSDFKKCTNNPTSCIYGKKPPIMPNVVMGGYDTSGSSIDFASSSTFVVTFLVKNTQDYARLKILERYESQLINYFKALSSRPDLPMPNIRISFSSESSIEAEINREVFKDLPIIALSYLVMLAYVAFSLGTLSRKWKESLVYSRFSLALSGICMVVCSITFSVAFFSFLKIKTTMIIAEVIPFLVLAVGVDNIFLIVHSFDSLNPKEPIETRIAIALSKTGPSILLTAISEITAFGIGAFVPMPAVSSFSLYAALAIAVDFFLQVTAFISLLTIDCYRKEKLRVDCIPCAKMADCSVPNNEDFAVKMVTKYYSPFLAKPSIKSLVFFIYASLLLALSAGIFKNEMGLDQKLAVPNDSYLINYFEDVSRYLQVGPPLYFVLLDVDFSTLEGKKLVAGKKFEDINLYSLSAMLEVNRKVPVSYIASPAAVWFDDYMTWLTLCCKKLPNGEYDPDRQDMSAECQLPTRYLNETLGGDEFMKYFPYFIKEIPSESCSYAGGAAYPNSILRNSTGSIVATNYRTYLSPLRSQSDFIGSLKSARYIAQRFASRNNLDYSKIFVYSPTFLFFEQYLTLAETAAIIVLVPMAVIFLINWALLGSFRLAILIFFMIDSILLMMLGAMGWWKISLNAVSVVNLAITAGISVEFVSNIARGYLIQSGPSRAERVDGMLKETGCSVFRGITMTKLLGVIVLAAARSKIFETFYFRMYLLIVLLGAFHGLVLFPVILSFIGPKMHVGSYALHTDQPDSITDE